MNEIIKLWKSCHLSRWVNVLIDLGRKIYISKDGMVSASGDQVELTIKLSEQDMLAVLKGEENVILYNGSHRGRWRWIWHLGSKVSQDKPIARCHQNI